MARSFNGTSSDYITLPARQWPQSAFTLAGWFYHTGSNIAVLCSIYDDALGAYMQFYALADDSITARIEQTTSIYIGRKTNTGALPGATLLSVAFTWSGGTTNASIKIYVSGSQVDTTDDGLGSFSASYSASNVRFFIGTQFVSSAPSFVWDGNIAEIGLWNVALDLTEIGALAKGYSPALIRSGNLIEYDPLLRANISVKGVAPTINGTTVVPHPRIIMPRKGESKRRFNTVAATQLQFIGFMGTSGV